MDTRTLKPKLGRWLSIEELKGLLDETPRSVCETIPVNRKLLEIASQFVEEREGWWEHPDWESFLDRLNSQGFQLPEEGKAPIGGILEIFKGYYHRDDFRAITEKRRNASPEDGKPSKPSPPRKARSGKRAQKGARHPNAR